MPTEEPAGTCTLHANGQHGALVSTPDVQSQSRLLAEPVAGQEHQKNCTIPQIMATPNPTLMNPSASAFSASASAITKATMSMSTSAPPR